eukprot:TRINITY_DN6156_c0_g1_i2.p1 TRINITY_DN6156_c0_g1~~TRINITY_DN6156_c0_g1_i2.p1  ORF type:complete len:385 (-),score=103.69 TRINITY_DN6156_c0_g1_i2:15-1169(-)
MTIVKEFRIPMPINIKDYRRGQRYSVARTNNEATKGKDGIELVEAKPWTDPTTGVQGYYTRKIYHLEGYLPGWIRAIMPSSATKLHEESWDAFPKSKTVLTSPFLGSKLEFVIESNHIDGDKGEQENAVGLSDEVLKVRKVQLLNIAKDKLTDKAMAADPLQDPTKVRSEKADFGPLPVDWLENTPASKCMCSYKVVTIKVAWWGLQTKAENWLIGTEEQIFLRFHKQLICWMDEWYNLSLEDVLAKERAIYEEMNKTLAKEGVVGSGADQPSSSTEASTATDATATSETDGNGEKKKKKKHRKHKGGRSGHHGGKKHRHHHADGEGEAAAEEDAAHGEEKPKKDKKKKKDAAPAEEDASASVSASVEHTEESGDESGSESDDE